MAKIKDFDDTIVGIVKSAFENHKTHARFQETQRAQLMAGHLVFSGVIFTGFMSLAARASSDGLVDTKALLAVALFVHAVLGHLVGLALTKFSVEFHRHFRHAEDLLAELSHLASSDAVRDIVVRSQLGTTTMHQRHSSRPVGRATSVAAIYNYTISLFIAVDAAAIVYLGLSDHGDAALGASVAAGLVVFEALRRWFKGYYDRLKSAAERPAPQDVVAEA